MHLGPRNLLTDVEGLRVGNASDERLKSGVTVVTADAPFTAAVHVMGGAPGTRESDLLAPDRTVQQVDALVLSGGSAFGLAAADGVMEALRAEGRGFVVRGMRVPVVPAAVVFDLANGGAKDWASNPYPALGRAAFESAGREPALGSRGAGTGAAMARHKGGLGSASLVVEGLTVAALAVANPVGSALTPGGRFWAAPFEMGAEFGALGPPEAVGGARLPLKTDASGASTTIAVVATDAGLTKAEATRLAVAAHDGIARAVVPSHTPLDGDLVFAVSTGRRELGAALPLLCHAAATCLARAIARAAWLARPAPGDLLPCVQMP